MVDVVERRLMLAANPVVLGTQFLDAASAGTRQQLVATFSADVTLDAADIDLRNIDSGDQVDVRSIGLDYSAASHIARLTFDANGAAGLPDGNYVLILHASDISAGGLPLDGNGDGVGGDDAVCPFSTLRGDLNHDRRVDATDAGIVQQALGKPATRLDDGDFTGDGTIDFNDLLALAKHYGRAATRPADGDATGDGKIDFNDLLALAKHYGHSGAGDVDGDGTITSADAAIVQAAADSALNPLPPVFASLSDDTGVSASDGITMAAALAGVVDANVARLTISLDSSAAVDASAAVQGSLGGPRGFSIDPARLETLLGGAIDDGSHVLHLSALDPSGSILGTTDVTFTLDTTAPSSVAIASPASGDVAGGLVVVHAQATDDVGIDRISLLADGDTVGAATAAPYSILWDTSVSNGSHALQAVAYDLAGNQSTSQPVSIKVYNRPVGLTLDGAQRFQTIDGLGVNFNTSAWHNGAAAAQIDTLIDQMGASVFRVIVETVEGWEDVNDDADPQTYDWAYYDALYATPKFTDLWNTIDYLNQRGVTVLLNVMGTVPTWMGGSVVNDNGEYAEMIASMLNYAVTVAHVHIDCFSDMNEQDLGQPEGPKVGPAQYQSILDDIETRLVALGIADQVPLLAGETSEPSSDWVVPLLSDPIVSPHLVHASFHNYYGNSGAFGSALAGSGVSWWVTEYGDAFWDGDRGTPVPDEWTFASNSLLNVLSHLNSGASGAMVYDGIDAFYQHHQGTNSLGQIAWNPDTDQYSIRKRFYANGLVDRFVRPDMIRIGATDSADDETLEEAAFLDPNSDQIVIVGMNTASSAAAITINLTGGLAATGFTLYLTDSDSLNMTQLGSAAQIGSSFLATIPADTMFALVSTVGSPAAFSPDLGAVDAAAAVEPAPARRRRGVGEAVGVLA